MKEIDRFEDVVVNWIKVPKVIDVSLAHLLWRASRNQKTERYKGRHDRNDSVLVTYYVQRKSTGR
jgi:hypothetical protein